MYTETTTTTTTTTSSIGMHMHSKMKNNSKFNGMIEKLEEGEQHNSQMISKRIYQQ
jgi:hypothetical protein